ncbi:hypothetical protein Ahy_B08g094133 [Arachis hypogaea]|uniref:Reverse transcriptase zinc-binding domain-containing protein n=1 Tax=Arachis hypogaea TaxID=3818 RepID=A0A444Y877_ARAHY|nr:hypothetical protein Ahy_B08g094133 [Arachis hypogaea]
MSGAEGPTGPSHEHQPTVEEQDQLKRSIKKVRKDGEGFTGTQLLQPRDEEWMRDSMELEGNFKAGKSFAQMVRGGFTKDHMEEDIVELSKEGNISKKEVAAGVENSEQSTYEKEENQHEKQNEQIAEEPAMKNNLNKKDKGKQIMIEQNDNYGAWMVVQRPKRGKKNEETKQGGGSSRAKEKQSNKENQSRYSVLQVEDSTPEHEERIEVAQGEEQGNNNDTTKENKMTKRENTQTKQKKNAENKQTQLKGKITEMDNSKTGSLNNPINVKTTDSPLWKELMKLWPMFQNFSTYYIGNGLSTLFWKHQWVKEEDCLLDLALNPDSIDPDSFVWEWTNPNGDWDIDKLHQNLPPNIVEKIIDIPAPQAELEDDRIGWKLSQDGDFSLNATYKSLRNWSKERNTIWEKVWSWKGPQRAKVFLWTAMHRRIMTNQRKAKIFGGTGNCSLCNSGIEDTLHALRNCPKASTIWVNLLKSNEIPGFFQSNWEDWIGVNLHKQLGKNDNLNWLDTFITTCWRICYLALF